MTLDRLAMNYGDFRMSRTLDFFDGQSSATIPTVEPIKKLATFANDAAYETDKGSAGADGDIYYNTTLDKIKFNTSGTWRTNEDELNKIDTVDPGVSDDNTAGFVILSLWLNSVSGALFRATDVSTGAAVWQEIAKDAILDSHIAATAAHGATGAVMGTTNVQVVSNKSFVDDNTTFEDNGDATKKLKFQLSTITTATTRTLTVPNANTTLLGTDVAQIITLKDYDGGTASNTSRMVIPKETTANLASLTDKEAAIAYDTTLNTIVFNDGADFKEISVAPSFTTVTKTANATLAASGEDNVITDATSGDLTLTLPAASGNNGLTYKITKEDSSANKVIIDPNAAETLDGNTTLEIYGEDKSIIIACDGSNWFTVSSDIQNVAFIKDEKSSGTSGGGFTSGSYQTRALNTLSGETDFITLASDQFTLPFGDYIIEARAPALNVNAHKCKLRNTSDASDTIIGSVEASIASAATNSFIRGSFTLTASKTFEIQHRGTTTVGGAGFGGAAAFGDVEVYTEVTITKVR